MTAVAWHNERMKQADLNLDLPNRRTHKRAFLDEMECVVPWKEFVALIEPHAPTKATAAEHFRLKQCCASTSCNNGLV